MPEVVAVFPTASGHEAQVTGPDPWGGYAAPCTGCGTSQTSEDVPPARAEQVMREAAEYHAQNCTRG